MRVPRIHVELPLAAGQELELPAAAARHVGSVLRLRAGAPLVLFDGRGGEYRASVHTLQRQTVRVRLLEHLPDDRVSPLSLTLLQALVRGERMDLIVQKATELGVTRIVPVRSEYCVVRLDEQQAARRTAHWRSVAAGACEQSGRNRLPEIGAPQTLADACRECRASGARWLLEPGAPGALAAAAAGCAAAGGVAILVGPEGGLSDQDRAIAGRNGFVPVHLGPRVLRAETAPLVAIALLQAAAGDLSGH